MGIIYFYIITPPQEVHLHLVQSPTCLLVHPYHLSHITCHSSLILVRAACVRCHETKCPLLTAFFSPLSLSLSAPVPFLPEGVIVKFCMGF